MSKFEKIIPSGSNFKQIFFKDGLTHINNNIRCNFVFDCLLMWKILILIYLLLILMTKKAMKHCFMLQPCRIHSKIKSPASINEHEFLDQILSLGHTIHYFVPFHWNWWDYNFYLQLFVCQSQLCFPDFFLFRFGELIENFLSKTTLLIF